MELRVRGVLILLGVLLVLGGGAVAGAQFAGLDLAALDGVAGAKEFLWSQTAIYAGAGAAFPGLLLIILAAASGGRKKKQEPASSPAPGAAAADQVLNVTPRAPASAAKPQPVRVAAPSLKPTASALPPSSAPAAPAEAVPATKDPRLVNRKRVTDLVVINDALKAYHRRHGVYPKAEGLSGFPERGAAWIPGLSPDFISELPRDPVSADTSGPKYVYVSDGKDYKLLAQGVSLVGGTNVEVLGVQIDPTRQPTAANASFGFWTPGFASV